jgi:choline kinase
MKVLLMAAGKGTRISRYIEGKPKCTVNIGGTTLIEYTMEQLRAHGITEVAMVLGYQGDIIKETLKHCKLNITYYYNYFYDVTNSIASAWFAKDFLDGDMILMNADVYLEPEVFDEVLNETRSPILFSDGSRKEEADYKLYYEDNELIKCGKQLEGQDISGEYVGVAKMNKEFIPQYIDRLTELISQGEHGMWWEDALYSFIDERAIYIKDIQGMFWAEVDYIEDYQRILKFRGIEDSLILKHWLGL